MACCVSQQSMITRRLASNIKTSPTNKLMKNTTILTMAALLLGSSGLMAQSTAYTKPSGFVTHTLKAGKYNMIGLTLLEAITVAGKFTAVSGTTLTDSGVDFDFSLTTGKTHILEVTSGTLAGTIQEVIDWSGNTITTPADLVADGLAVGDTYQIRLSQTLQGVFGQNNEAGLKSGSASEADLIWVPDGASDYTKFYYHPGASFPVAVPAGWRVLGGAEALEVPLVYTDGLLVERRGDTDLNLVITGSVKTTSVSIAIPGKYTYISSVFPVGSTLSNSEISDSMKHGLASEADLIWIPKDDATDYDKYYYHPGSSFPVTVAAGWKLLGGGDSDQADASLKAGMIIEKRASEAFNLKLTPPSGYSDL